MTTPRTQRVYRTDIGSLRPVQRRDDGTIRVDAYLTRCGVFTYRQADGSVRRELRLPEDVFAKETTDSFLGVPVTNDHPPDMVTAKNANRYAVGSQIGALVRDEDHVRSPLSIWEAGTIEAMNAGKTQISCGYTCDCLEQSGTHPLYGDYDAIQKNIRGNHIAIVDRGRAGATASARMDGMMVLDGDEDSGTVLARKVLTVRGRPCKSGAMPAKTPPAARVEVVLMTGDEDPIEAIRQDGDPAPAAPKGKRPPADDPDDDGDEDQTADDAMYDDDGDLTEHGERKVAASTFGLPDKRQLPIHNPEAVKDSMKKFPAHEFDSADEKHGAFNRIKGKALQFGMQDDAARFEKKHAGKLDRADSAPKDTMMTPTEIKDLQEKADKRKAKLVEARTKIDSLEQEKAALVADKAKLEGEKASLTKDLETAKAAHKDSAGTVDQARIDAKIELLDQARKTGAEVNSKMSDLEIMRAVIKHVDKEDVPADKATVHPYVEACYAGAVKRATKDAADTKAGADALAAARGTVVPPVVNPTPADKKDDDTDEDAAKARLRADSATQWTRKETK